MVAPTPFRTWTVEGSGGRVTADLLAGRVTLERRGHVPDVVEAPPGERDRAEQLMIADLVALGDDPAEPRCGVGQGVAALEVVAAARRSHETGRPAPVPMTGRRAVAR
jgi:predicted dehydrogenase